MLVLLLQLLGLVIAVAADDILERVDGAEFSKQFLATECSLPSSNNHGRKISV
jgi:hypothetical protein